MKATLFFDGPQSQRMVGAFAVAVPKFAYVFEAREWALRNGVRFVDNRYKRAEVREDGYTWQIVTKTVPRPICAQMAWTGYAGVSLEAEPGSELKRKVEEVDRAYRELCVAEWRAQQLRLLRAEARKNGWDCFY